MLGGPLAAGETPDPGLFYQGEGDTICFLTRDRGGNIAYCGAGTGKSSAVKAVGNALFGEGLRIIEVRKDQLRAIPRVLDELAENPLKFVLFIDDLSFLKDDDNYSALKAVLEGSVTAKSNNVVIYANATILGRVTIGEGCVVGANEWVTEDMKPNTKIARTHGQDV